MRYRFAVLSLYFDFVKMLTYFFYPSGVSNSNYDFPNFLRPYIKMINGTPCINNQFRFCDVLHDFQNKE